MKKTYFLVKILIIYLFFISSGFAVKSNYFDKGKILFDKKSLEFRGWKTKDAYSNEVSFSIINLETNVKIENKIFKIPREEDL